MKEVIIYVEGAADKLTLQVLLRPLIAQKLAQGVFIEFFETPSGDRKESVLIKAPLRAVNILRSKADAEVVLMPDLYPPNKGFPHSTFEEMKAGILKNFAAALKQKNIQDTRLLDRFHVFCLKHDLEALILAVPQALAVVLEVETIKPTWKIPVEDQNHQKPPKRIVEALFEQAGQRYVETRDAPLILGLADYQEVSEKCPQCFQPFVNFLQQT